MARARSLSKNPAPRFPGNARLQPGSSSSLRADKEQSQAGAWRAITPAEAGVEEPAAARPAGGGDALARLIGAPPDARARLARLDLTVVGVGVVGGYFADLLAEFAPGTVRFLDPDFYELRNLRAQPIDRLAIGRPKVEVVGRRLKARSPGTRVLVAQRRYEEVGVADLCSSTVVALAGDNLPLTVAVSQRACALGQALVQGSVHGPTGVAQVRRTAPAAERARACPVCTWDAGERRALARQTRFACDGSGQSRANPAGPSAALAALGSLAGSLMAFEVLRLALGFDDADAVVEYCALSRSAVVSPLVANRRCLVVHQAWRKVRAARPLGELSPGQIFALAGARSACRRADRALEVDGLRWVARGDCECRQHPPVAHFVGQGEARETLGVCGLCGCTLRAHPFYTHVETPGALFAASLDRPLAALGAGVARAALVRSSSSTVLVHGSEEAR